MNDLGKIAVIAGIMGALLLFGLFLASDAPEPVAENPTPVVVEEEPMPETHVILRQSLEMLDPIYSEKAVFYDDTIRIAFHGAFVEDELESKIPFWIHNVSDDVINILWDRCSLQLPNGNTVNVVNEAGYEFFAPGRTISIAPAGDLFDAVIPVSEIVWTDEEGPSLTRGILSEGTFTLVLAVERAAGKGCQHPKMEYRNEDGCPGESSMPKECRTEKPEACEGREIAYYTFRFVLR